MKNNKICKNCSLFNKFKKICSVAILHEGKKYNLPVSEGDQCHLDELGIEVNQVRWWVEDPVTGKKTNQNGIVKMEYPEGFFGKEL